nr:immunoglobulin light chain junction region [Mus musculus]NSL97025.1 immunoglobulin light chain junction region [Mus musculus]NSL97360.1 immunoglobulin light chain junction region [Mus musculus]NSL97561.1 immunoglobulin light chain junction region [Mus musculus]NSL97593.1 immunoglobulin light chain junction region [Mus musculus]
CQQYWSTPWTF